MSAAVLQVTPALGRRAEDRFERSMAERGYDVWRYDAYTQIRLFLQPAAARRVEAGLHADYDPTALFWRCAPDYGVRPQSGGRSWLAEVKGPSERWANLVLEATQLMNLYLLAQCLWLDIRYVYAAPEQPLRCQSVERVRQLPEPEGLGLVPGLHRTSSVPCGTDALASVAETSGAIPRRLRGRADNTPVRSHRAGTPSCGSGAFCPTRLRMALASPATIPSRLSLQAGCLRGRVQGLTSHGATHTVACQTGCVLKQAKAPGAPPKAKAPGIPRLKARHLECIDTVYVNPDHPCVGTLRRLRRQTDVQWNERPNARFYDPYVKVMAEVLARWPIVECAEAGYQQHTRQQEVEL